MTDLLTSNERLRQLLIEARPYIESFALLSKHPTAPDDARNLAWKINEAIRATREASTSEPPQPGAKEQIKRYDFELIDARTYMERAAMVETSEGRWVRWSEVQSILPTHETTELNSCRARLHDISNGPLYDLQMSARREVGLAIDEARTAIARACHDLRRATTVAESSVGTASTQPLKAAASPNDAFRWICPKCTTVNGIDDLVCLGGTCGTKRPEKAAASLPPCECLIADKEPSAYHAVKCPRFVAGKL